MFYFTIILLVWFLIEFCTRVTEPMRNKKYWKKFNMKNFPFEWKGKTFWYSRSVAVNLCSFAKNKNNEWCVLANKRGKGTPDFQGYWNVPCGYLDFNESGEEAAIRETREETGVNIPLANVILRGTSTSPKENRQNVSFRYMAILDKTTDEYTFSTKNMEENEVDSIAWIPISQIDSYKGAFNHDAIIKNLAAKFLF